LKDGGMHRTTAAAAAATSENTGHRGGRDEGSRRRTARHNTACPRTRGGSLAGAVPTGGRYHEVGNPTQEGGAALSARPLSGAPAEEQDDDDDVDGGGDHVEDQSRPRTSDVISPGRLDTLRGRTGRSPYAHIQHPAHGAPMPTAAFPSRMCSPASLFRFASRRPPPMMMMKVGADLDCPTHTAVMPCSVLAAAASRAKGPATCTWEAGGGGRMDDGPTVSCPTS
jgi:hypothetical protein